MTDHILLVLGVAEGRRFPKRPHHQLVVEANFDGEHLSTDVVKHIDAPHFNTELAWEIDKKSLHQHRMQRTPIKVQVFSLESSNMKKELVGYCILDLRTAQQDNPKKAAWHSLLSSKYQHMKPELKTSLTVEVDKIKQHAISEPVEPKKKSPNVIDENNNLDVVLDNDEGYYLIGSQTPDCQIFVLSVSVGGTRNLVKLVPSDIDVNAENGFYFYYTLFDNDVTNETFYDLMNPTMSTERATVRIYTTPMRLENYLRKKRVIEVYLCSSENTLGQATVSLVPLITGDLFSKTNTVEGLFPLTSPKSKDGEEQALVGISIVLRKEEQDAPPRISPVLAENPSKVRNGQSSPIPHLPPPTFQTPPKKLVDSRPKTKAHESPQKFQSSGQDQVIQQEKNHHFAYSVDIRSISNLNIQHPLYCVCRYTYPFFGSASPIITNPPVYVQRNSEVLLPQAFCKFEFASTKQLLQSTLARVPLIVEVWSKDANVKDKLLGIAQVHLSNVFFQEHQSTSSPLVRSENVHIVSADSPGNRIGTLHIVLGFEDKGEVHRRVVPHQKVAQSLSSSTVTMDQDPSSTSDPIQPRDTREYQVAMALELWRQQQEEHFQNQLSVKETEYMKMVAEEWKQRDGEREMILKRKLEEYSSLQARLKNTLADVEQREKQVVEQELLLQKNERSLAEEYDRKMVELREGSRRLKEEYEHQLQMEKTKYNDLEERYKQIVNQLHDVKGKVQDRENALYAMKESMLSRPEIKMQSEMNLLLLEKSELERKIESVTKSKIHYKQQWGRALRELARFKLNEQEAAKSRLKKQQQEIDHMKLRYLAAEEKQIMKTEREELHNVKDEINKRLQELQSTVTNTNIDEKENEVPIEEQQSFQNKTRIAKLIEERDTLLQTGVYTVNDRVINELDKEIQQLISANV